MNNLCIIATSRLWNKDLLEKVHDSTGCEVHYISNPQELTLSRLSKLRPRYVFFPHWSHIIQPNIFKTFKCVIFHMTDLPFGRGGSPLQNLISRGISKTKISALRCSEEIDAGPIYLKRPLSLHGSAEEIYRRATKEIENMIVKILKTDPVPVPQKGKVTMFKRRKPTQSNLAGIKTLDEAYDLIRMLDADGYPHAFLDSGPFRLQFRSAERKAGQVLAAVRIALRSADKKY
jgi:methionyl-tRNA formyltransferase